MEWAYCTTAEGHTRFYHRKHDAAAVVIDLQPVWLRLYLSVIGPTFWLLAGTWQLAGHSHVLALSCTSLYFTFLSCVNAALHKPASPHLLIWPSSGHVYMIHLAVWPEVTWLPLCFKLKCGYASLIRPTLLRNLQCCEFWKDTELRDREGGTIPLSHSAVFSLQSDTAVRCLMNDTLITSNSSNSLYNYWCPASPTVHLRQQHCFHYASATLR